MINRRSVDLRISGFQCAVFRKYKMIKTVTSKVDQVSDYVRKNHPYDVAEVISSKIDNGNPPYLKWIADVTMGGKQK
ncbi:protein CutA homolog isoform X2 [Littorina saxatilis]|uniref:protein CutA homolog isoform X2 n=1 Tax=Littorina saxatilis TaxID=31220 RepID=UPI0038B42368